MDEEPKVISLRYVQAPEHKTRYANSTRVGISPWDIRMIIGASKETADGTQISEDFVTLVMAPAHAKAFVDGVSNALASYESTYGKLPDVMAILKAGNIAAADELPKKSAKSKPSSA